MPVNIALGRSQYRRDNLPCVVFASLERDCYLLGTGVFGFSVSY